MNLPKSNPVTLIFSLLGGVILVAYFGQNYLKLKNRELKNDAMSTCMSISRYETRDERNGVVTVTPMDEQFKKCMKEMGYESAD